MTLAELLIAAQNPLHSPEQLRRFWDEYEASQWFLAVLGDRLKVTDLQSKWVEPVKALIVKHAHLR